MAIGIALGGPLGLALGDPTLMAAGIAIGSGAGWGIGREVHAVYDPDRPARSVAWLAGVAGLGAALGGFIGWLLDLPALIMLGIALGAGFGAAAGRRFGSVPDRS